MPYYETVLIVRQDLSTAHVKDLKETIGKIITESSGQIHKEEDWGLRTMAYKINKSRKARYLLVEYEAPGAAAIEVERQLRLNEDVLRSLTVRLEALSDGPSPIMDKDRQDKTAHKKEAA